MKISQSASPRNRSSRSSRSPTAGSEIADDSGAAAAGAATASDALLGPVTRSAMVISHREKAGGKLPAQNVLQVYRRRRAKQTRHRSKFSEHPLTRNCGQSAMQE